jgi:hypothetical protein
VSAGISVSITPAPAQVPEASATDQPQR